MAEAIDLTQADPYAVPLDQIDVSRPELMPLFWPETSPGGPTSEFRVSRSDSRFQPRRQPRDCSEPSIPELLKYVLGCNSCIFCDCTYFWC